MENKKNFYVQYHEIYKNIEKKEETIKLLTINRSVFPFPNMPYTDEIEDNFKKNVLLEISNHDELFFLGLEKFNDKAEAQDKPYFEYGCVCKIECVTMKEKSVNYICNVLYRARIEEFFMEENGVVFVKIMPVVETNVETENSKNLLNRLKESYFNYVNYANRKVSTDLISFIKDSTDPNVVINLMSVSCDINLSEQYSLICEADTEKRLEKLILLINKLFSMELINKKIDEKIRQENDKRQKEMYIKEKIKYLNEEIDEADELEILEGKVKACGMPVAVEELILNEVNKLKKLPTMAADYSVYKNHIDTVIELPWNISTVDEINIAKAKEVLDADHYGLEKVKTRILEYLAVLKLNEKVSGQILCLVGAPGVGKTSIAKSIAKALNRKFVKLTLGGMHDESEIRGHRKTFVGAMCGKIMYNLKNCGTNNPVFLLDEIDKISKDVHGDPASALLEVLDPEQNDSFRDNFVEVPFDLSRVIFIATANNANDIPEALYDRMEVIQVDSYTSFDKLNIAKNYLISKECKNNGILVSDIKMNDEVIKFLVDNYTYEAGVRNLERLIAKICRTIAVAKISDNVKNLPMEITTENIAKILDVPPAITRGVRSKPEVGTSYGLGWSPYGGSILTIECLAMPGKGEIEITGNLKDVMKESVKIAYTVAKHEILKENAKAEFKKQNLHLNVCEGGTKKDGPSAGGVLALVIYSALTNQKIRNNFAMTGEISLAGNIYAIGGLREKLYACVANNVENVIVPAENKNEVMFLPKEITEKLNIHYVTHISEIIKLCIIK